MMVAKKSDICSATLTLSQTVDVNALAAALVTEDVGIETLVQVGLHKSAFRCPVANLLEHDFPGSVVKRNPTGLGRQNDPG